MIKTPLRGVKLRVARTINTYLRFADNHYNNPSSSRHIQYSHLLRAWMQSPRASSGLWLSTTIALNATTFQLIALTRIEDTKFCMSTNEMVRECVSWKQVQKVSGNSPLLSSEMHKIHSVLSRLNALSHEFGP